MSDTPASKTRSANIGLTLGYPLGALFANLPRPATAGIPGEAFTPTGEGHVSDGSYSASMPTVRLSYTLGAPEDTLENSRHLTAARFGLFAEYSQFNFTQTAVPTVGPAEVSELNVDGWMLNAGSLLESGYLTMLISDSPSEGQGEEVSQGPKALHFIGVDLGLGLGLAGMDSVVRRPDGGEDHGEATALNFYFLLRFKLAHLNMGPLSADLAWATRSSLQLTQINNESSTGSFGVLDMGPELSLKGYF